ncbi:hypothetical protein BRADI_1g75492v3, partial [Brachypodium distachyon]
SSPLQRHSITPPVLLHELPSLLSRSPRSRVPTTPPATTSSGVAARRRHGHPRRGGHRRPLHLLPRDEQPDVQGLAVLLSSERYATNSHIEYSDVAAYRISLGEDTKAINQLVSRRRLWRHEHSVGILSRNIMLCYRSNTAAMEVVVFAAAAIIHYGVEDDAVRWSLIMEAEPLLAMIWAMQRCLMWLLLSPLLLL